MFNLKHGWKKQSVDGNHSYRNHSFPRTHGIINGINISVVNTGLVTGSKHYLS